MRDVNINATITVLLQLEVGLGESRERERKRESLHVFGPVVDVVTRGCALEESIEPVGQSIEKMILKDDLVLEEILPKHALSIGPAIHQHATLHVRPTVRDITLVVQAEKLAILLTIPSLQQITKYYYNMVSRF